MSMEQDAPDDSDYRREAESDAKERAWKRLKKRYADLLGYDEDVAAWMFNDAWNAGAAFSDSWGKR